MWSWFVSVPLCLLYSIILIVFVDHIYNCLIILVLIELVNVIQGIQKPAWLEALYTQKFFAACSFHETAKKNEKNVYCLDCCTSICPHCLPSHRCHRLLQIRRYVYHDVVRLEDLQKLVDCNNVQVRYMTCYTNSNSDSNSISNSVLLSGNSVS